MAVLADLDDAGTKIILHSEWRYKELCKSIPGSSWSKDDRVWRVPLSWTTCLALRSTFGTELEIGPALTDWAYNHLNTFVNPAMALRDLEDFDGNPDLFPHQRAGVEFLATARRALLADEPGLGKAQPLDARVLTPTGWTTMGDLSVGDRVVGSDGLPTEVTGVFPQGERDIYRVTFSDGASVECDGEHLWLTNTSLRRWRGSAGSVKTLTQIRDTLVDSSGKRQHYIPVVDPVVFDDQGTLDVDPYVLGVLIGDGHLERTPKFSSADDEIVMSVSAAIPATLSVKKSGASGYDYAITGPANSSTPNPLTVSLRAHGLMPSRSATKFIPEPYLRASVTDRVSLLQGLLDTDGYVSKSGDHVGITTVSYQLSRDIADLVGSLGGVARVRTKQPHYTDRNGARVEGQLAYVLTLVLPNWIAPFRLARKAARVRLRTKYPVYRNIKSIEYVGRKMAQCISVAADDHLYVTDHYAVTHNTAQAIRALKRLEDAGETVFPALIVAPNTVKRSWQREFERWWPGIHIVVVRGTATQRRKQLSEKAPCALHPVTPIEPTTRRKSAGSVTSTTSESPIQTTPNDSARTHETGRQRRENDIASNTMSSGSTDLLSKSMTHGSNGPGGCALYAPEQPYTSITTTELAESEVSSASNVTSALTQPNKTSHGSTESECTCNRIVWIMNWESLRFHSRLAPYGSIALAKCVECGGLDPKITATRCEVHQGELNRIDFKAVIADEIHRSKDPKSKQTRALWAATGDADIRFALTGTPIASNVVDLWAILHWLSPENWPSKTKWIDRMVDTMLNAFGGMMVLGIKPAREAEFQQSISPHMRRMLKARVLPFLPPVVTERRDVEMSTKQAKAYHQMRDTMIAELEEGEAITAPSVLTQTLRLLQFASSYAELVIDPATGEPHAVLAEPSCKVDALMDDIKAGDFGDDSVAVCAVSRQLIDLLSAQLTKADIPHGKITGTVSDYERQKAIDDFQEGKTKWILFTAQAGGVGVTLTAARRLIMLQRPWSLVDYKQALDRVHRIGSEIHDSIVITDYVTVDSIEERVIDVLDTKADNFDQVVKDRDKLLAWLRMDGK